MRYNNIDIPQTATTIEQSHRLLGCEVEAETADMMWFIFDKNDETSSLEPELLAVNWKTENVPDRKIDGSHLPAWSLNGLLSLLPRGIGVDNNSYRLYMSPSNEGWDVEYRYTSGDKHKLLWCTCGRTPIEACVKMIEWLTKNPWLFR